MVMKKTKYPIDVQACLWSEDFRKLDLKRDKTKIITQILNRGTFEAMKWLRKRYTWREIKNVFKNPQRGLWFPKTLHFWSGYFGIRLTPVTYQKALLHMGPR